MKFSALLLVVAGVVETSNAFVPVAPKATVSASTYFHFVAKLSLYDFINPIFLPFRSSCHE